MYEDGDHLARERARPLHRHLLRSAPSSLSVIFHSLDFVFFFVVDGRRLLDAAAPRSERAAARGELLLLWLRSPLVPDSDRHVDDRGLLRCARHGGVAGTSPAVSLAQHRIELRDAGLLQVLQLLRRKRPRGVGSARPARSASQRCESSCRSVSRSTPSRP